MRGPKATMSVDGLLRVDLRLTGRVSRDDLAIALIRASAPYHSSDDEREELSAARAEETIRKLLWESGAESEGWSDDMEDGQRDEWLEWARRQVDRAYPALAPEGERGGQGS